MVLMREVTAAWTIFGMRWMSCRTPSMRKRIRLSSRLGSMWMSLARLSKACWSMNSTALTTCWSDDSISVSLFIRTSCSRLPRSMPELRSRSARLTEWRRP